MVCEANLPELTVGDWLYFHNIGAYSRGLGTDFNGFGLPVCYYFIRQSDRLAKNSVNISYYMFSILGGEAQEVEWWIS